MSDAKRKDLRWYHVALLRALDEVGGNTAAQVGKLVWTGSTARQTASTAGPRLKELEVVGLARRLDAESPVAWLRTKAGTAAVAPFDDMSIREIP